MKALEQLLIQSRTRWRSLLARGRGAQHPARLVIRLDDLDAPGPVPAAALTRDNWYRLIIHYVEWAGVTPVHFISRPQNPMLAHLVRFAWRLECPTVLRTCASGLDEDTADLLVDSGLQQLHLRVAGRSEAVQQAICGESVADVDRALGVFLEARKFRDYKLPVIIEIPFNVQSALDAPAVVRWAREQGVDGVRIAPPYEGPAFEERFAVMMDLLKLDAPLNRTPRAALAALQQMRSNDGPGIPRRSGHCPVASLRLEVGPDGQLSACPFHGGTTKYSGSMPDAWEALQEHHAKIRACPRECHHVELAG